MVLNPAHDVVLLGHFDQVIVVFQFLNSRLGDEDVKLSLECVQSDGIVSA
jgi:hypothetical protein